MTAQLELDLARRRAEPAAPSARTWGRRTAAFARALLLWTPVWVPLVFLGQLLALGLAPTLEERARLDAVEAEVRARAEALRAEELELAEQARMLDDEIFRERVRRSLVDPTAVPLTLERARAGAKP